MSAKGLKRACSECGSRFYDMNKRPIICPSCGTEFTMESKTKSKKITAKVAETPVVKKPENEDVLKDIDTDGAEIEGAADLDESDIDPIDASDGDKPDS